MLQQRHTFMLTGAVNTNFPKVSLAGRRATVPLAISPTLCARDAEDAVQLT